MRNLKTEIEQYMTALDRSDRQLTSRFLFPPEFIGFQGHFPTGKILPGACQIQCVLSTIEKLAGKRAKLREIVLAKYSSPVFPDEELTCSVRETAGDDGGLTVKASLTKGDKKVTEMKLLVSLT